MSALVTVTQQPSLFNKLKAMISHTPELRGLVAPNTPKNQGFLKHFSGMIGRLVNQNLGLSLRFITRTASFPRMRESHFIEKQWDACVRRHDMVTGSLSCLSPENISLNTKALAQ